MAKAAPLNHLVWRVLSVLAVLAGLAALTATSQAVQPKAPEGQTATPLSMERASDVRARERTIVVTVIGGEENRSNRNLPANLNNRFAADYF
jgi:hypothetical protein